MRSPAELNVCRGKLRFQISRTYTKYYYPNLKSNRFIYLGVEDSLENRPLALLKLNDLRKDLINGQFHPDNEEKYYVINIIKGIEKKDIPSLSSLIAEHISLKKKLGIIQEGTYIRDQLYIRTCQRISQDLTKINKILDELDELDCAESTRRDTFEKIMSAINWGVKKNILPDKFLNYVEEISDRKQIVIDRIKKNPPKRSNKLHGKENKERYFTEEEVNTITKAYYKEYGDTSRPQMIEAAFKLGCRPGELTALQWKDLDYIYCNDEKVMTINVDKAYSVEAKKSKSVKNYKPRMIPISKQAQKLFERIKPSNYSPDDLVFTSNTGTPLNRKLIYAIWYGRYENYKTLKGTKKGFTPGLVSKLAMEGKISKYLCPYQCRASFITNNLLKGSNLYTVAKWAGHDVKTLLKHYESITGLEERVPD